MKGLVKEILLAATLLSHLTVLRSLLSARQGVGSGNTMLERTGIVLALKELLGYGKLVLNLSHNT